MVEVQARHLLVELLGQHVDLLGILAGVAVQRQLREHLIGEGRGHHEARMPGGAAEVEQPPLGEDEHAVPVGEPPFVVLRLDPDALDPRHPLEAGHVDLVVEVADVAHDRLVLHPPHLRRGDDVLVAGGGDEEVGGFEQAVERVDLVAFHRGLQRADRVDLRDDDATALPAERLGAPLAHLPVAADDRDLAAQHHVRRPREAVRQRVPAAVHVVELALGDRVVDVDGREQQRPVAHHLVQPVDPGRRLLADAPDGRADPPPLPRVAVLDVAQQVEKHAPLLRVAFGVEGRDRAGTLELVPLVDQERGVAAIVDDQVGAAAVGPEQRLVRAPPVLGERLALPREDRNAARSAGRAPGLGTTDRDRRRRVVLRREDVAGRPAHVGPELRKGLDQHRGLHGHVQAAHHPCACQRPFAGMPAAQDHQPGHLLLRQPDLVAPARGQGQIRNLVGQAPGPRGFLERVNLFDDRRTHEIFLSACGAPLATG